MTARRAPPEGPLVVNGWSIYAHPVLLDQLDHLIAEVEARRARDPATYLTENCSKRLAAIVKLMTEVVPADPAGPQFRQGDTLGTGRRHWFRAKFFQQYRLFFRFDSSARVLLFAWVNDDRTLRAYGSRTDAYETFKAMLDHGRPPDNFDVLLEETREAAGRLQAVVEVATKLES